MIGIILWYRFVVLYLGKNEALRLSGPSITNEFIRAFSWWKL